MDELVETLKKWIERYFEILPFKRKGIYAKMITEPEKTMLAEVKKTGFGVGLRDMLTGMLPYLLVALAIMLLVSVAISIVLLVVGKLGLVSPYAVPALGIVAVCFAAYILLSIISWIISTAIIHLVAKVLGGKGSFGKMLGLMGTLSGASSLFMIPVMLISIIPIIGQVAMIVSVYLVYLQYKAIRTVHGIDRNRAIATVLIPIILVAAIFVALYMAYMMLMLGVSAAS